MRKVSRRQVTVGGVALLTAEACGTRNAASLKELEGGVELTVRRGSMVSAVTVKPPHVIGREMTLRLDKGKLKGSIAGQRFDAEIEDDLISGMVTTSSRDIAGRARSGSIEVDVFGDETGVEASGLWAGERVDMRFTPMGVTGSLASLKDVGRCEYRLDKNLGQGVYQGSSSYVSLAEETVLVVPPKLFEWLRWSEIIALLLAVLSTPAVTYNEETILENLRKARDQRRGV